MINDLYLGQRCNMRSAVKKEVVARIEKDIELKAVYYSNQSQIALEIIRKCDQFTKPTLQKNVIEAIANKIIDEMKLGIYNVSVPRHRFMC